EMLLRRGRAAGQRRVVSLVNELWARIASFLPLAARALLCEVSRALEEASAAEPLLRCLVGDCSDLRLLEPRRPGSLGRRFSEQIKELEVFVARTGDALVDVFLLLPCAEVLDIRHG
ncbi:unnamed protein product, partial [Polarella glacialis]